MTGRNITNIVIAGIGGQGVLKASDILSNAAFKAGFDVKKAEVHGMSQRGGSVTTDIRFGSEINSPMIPDGTADVLLVLDETQIDNNIFRLAEGGIILHTGQLDISALPSPKTLNVAMIGMLSGKLPDISEDILRDAICSTLPEHLHEMNMKAFDIGIKSAMEA